MQYEHGTTSVLLRVFGTNHHTISLGKGMQCGSVMLSVRVNVCSRGLPKLLIGIVGSCIHL